MRDKETANTIHNAIIAKELDPIMPISDTAKTVSVQIIHSPRQSYEYLNIGS